MYKYGTDPKHVTRFMTLDYVSPEYEDYQGTIVWMNPPYELVVANIDELEKDSRVLAIWVNHKTMQCVVAGKDE
jgi:hypothetical protein